MFNRDECRNGSAVNGREFIRHPDGIPLQVEPVPGSRACGADVARFGGLEFVTGEAHDPGTELLLRIPVVDPGFETRARVAWCESTDHGYLVGVNFLDAEDAFRSRMMEQICAIEAYRREMESVEGRTLTGNQAATEWIGKVGGRFPDP